MQPYSNVIIEAKIVPIDTLHMQQDRCIHYSTDHNAFCKADINFLLRKKFPYTEKTAAGKDYKKEKPAKGKRSHITIKRYCCVFAPAKVKPL